jgi:hypothetical protein
MATQSELDAEYAESEASTAAAKDKPELLRIIDRLEAETIIPGSSAEMWKKLVRSGDIESADQIVQKVNDMVTNIVPRESSNKALQEKVARTEEVLQQLDLDTEPYEWQAANLNIVDRIANMGVAGMEAAGRSVESLNWYDAGMELMTLGAYTSEEARDKRDEDKAEAPPDFSDHKLQFIKQLLTNKAIDNVQYQELTKKFNITSDEVSLGSILEQLSDWGITDDAIQSTLEESTTAVWRRENRLAQLEEDTARIDKEEESLLSDDQKLKRRAQFERLDEEFPGRYVWNPDTGYVYEAGTGQLVDANGEVVGLNSQGELPEGYVGDIEYWDKAVDVERPWMEYGIDVDTYYDLFDVAKNPDRYHKEGIERFASGGQFLGGFASDYNVPQDEWTRANQKYGDSSANYTDAQLSGEETVWSPYGGSPLDFQRGTQAVRRPWYDPMDNWALYAGRSPESIAEQQQELLEMGALTPDDITEGTWGKAEADAMEKMMFIANGQAERIEDIDMDFWSNYWDEEASSGSKRAAFAAPSYRTLDPARIQLTIEDTVRRSLGRDASSDELADLGAYLSDTHRQSFSADVQAMENEYNAQGRAIDDQVRQSAGEVEDVDYEARFQQTFNDQHSAELDRYSRTQNVQERQSLIGGALNNFMGQLGGGIGGGSIGGR